MTLAERLLKRMARPGTTVDFTGARCLRRRFIRSGCDTCARACRPQAIYPGEGEVKIDSSRCTGCLVCTAACPTEALAGRDSRMAKVPQHFLSRRGETLVCCERTMRHGNEIILPCLGGLAKEQLAAGALLTGGLILLLHRCHDCHSPWVPEVLQTRLDELRQQWCNHAAADRIHLHLEGPPPTPAQPAPDRDPAPDGDIGGGDGDEEAAPKKATVDRQENITSERRDFFRAFRELSFHAAAETWTTLREDEQGREEQWSSSKHEPGWLKLLQKAGERDDGLGRELVLPLLYALRLDPACTFCGACAALCPSGAISTGDDDELQRLHFLPLLCSGCGLCQEFCPARAIHVQPGWPQAMPKAGEPHLLGEKTT